MAARLKTNILANYLGQGWVALMAIVFVPFYSRALGMEGFGLVGLMLSVQAMALLLDLGLGGVMNRELARRSVTECAAGSMRELVRTLECFIWPSCLVIAIAINAAGPWLAGSWLHPEALSKSDTLTAITMMAVAVALQWPATFYTNGLSGLERQPTANAINAIFATLRSVGAAAVLALFSPSVLAFMAWYAAVGATQSAVSAYLLWRALPPGRARFRAHELRSARRFAGGLFLITGTAIILMQLDRIILSATRPLAEVGYFTLALTVAAALGRAIQPIFNAVYPRFSRLVAAGDEVTLAALYHECSQYLVVITAALGGFLIAFAEPVVRLWTGDVATAGIVALPLAILVAGSVINCLLNLPYALQLAHAWTGLTGLLNSAAVVVMIPLGIIMIRRFGLPGAATLWLLTNLFTLAIGLPLMHRRLLRGHLGEWYLRDVLPPVAAVFVAALVLRQTLPDSLGMFARVSWLALSGVVMLLTAVAASPATRAAIRGALRRGR
ncbi:lipopolysaccharide biosynthesis protein [Luteibacter sp.]|uniref:lipopolysaccharide biosynthesis protein n=1 Tax=Luteibacter sp. TaxID=1886636 RepID=UPI003F7D35F0